MQVDQDMPTDKLLVDEVLEECGDEMMKTTISSEEKEKEGNSPTNHASRIQKLHNQRMQNYLKTEMLKMPVIDRQEVKDP